ncbi:MAG: class 1 fructose-bisphosphatase [Planctomycetes bacterium]|nr:class 1 fructose-bisphosphatase [Planctomycetota bacterium]
MEHTTCTLNRFVIEQQRNFPEARGKFTELLEHIAFASKIVNRETSKAGLVDILGLTGHVNVQGEEVQKLDQFAQSTFFKALDHTGLCACIASEEEPDILPIPDHFPCGDYVVTFDPLDGSTNIDANVSIGTIFGIHRRVSTGDRGETRDALQPGRNLVAAGYVIYGSSTILVYTCGGSAGVHGFTLDPSVGEFFLSHNFIRTPVSGSIYSTNEGNYQSWNAPTREFVDRLKTKDNPRGKSYSTRYIGSLVADFHRNLLYGGVFLYPSDTKDPSKPTGKLRLLSECAPLAFVCEAAGGKASTGYKRILDVEPTELHQRVPLIIGSPAEVEFYEQICAKHSKG